MLKKIWAKIKSIKWSYRKFIVAILIMITLYIIPVHVLFLAELPYADVTWTKNDGRDINFTLNRPPQWVELNQISRNIRSAIISSEDANFWNHPGFEVEAIMKAANLAWKTKQFKKGGSTITQQLAKNLFFGPEKRIVRKVRELQAAVYLEWRWGKERILENYLNVIEFGPGVYGISNACKYYFKKSPKNITAREAAYLAMVLPNPKKYSNSYRKGSLTKYAKRRIDQILRNMYRSNYISSDQRGGGGTGFLSVPTPVPTVSPNPDSQEILDLSEAQTLVEDERISEGVVNDTEATALPEGAIDSENEPETYESVEQHSPFKNNE